MCEYDFNLCYLPFLRSYVFFMPFYIFIFLWSTRAFPFAPTYSSIVMRKPDLQVTKLHIDFRPFFRNLHLTNKSGKDHFKAMTKGLVHELILALVSLWLLVDSMSD
ncbi:hypothetical protein GmHk_05G013098 [Glycine max]|nr:hypothetical protein GmHk_05G013098 [Glycine max]